MARPDGDLPEIEVIGDADQIRTEVEIVTTRERSRTPWIAGLVLVALLATVGVATRDRGSAQDDAAPPTTPSTSATTTTTRPPRTTTTRTPETPVGEYITGSPAPVFGEPVGASLLFGNDSGSRLRQLDLDTGWIVELPPLIGAADTHWWDITPVMDGAIVMEDGGMQFVELPRRTPGEALDGVLTDLHVEGIDEDHEIRQVLPTERVDRVWVISGPRTDWNSTTQTAHLFEPSGARLMAIRPVAMWPRAATSYGLLYTAGGQSYLQTEDGVLALGPGIVHAANGELAGRVTCDDELSCRQEIVNLRTSEVIPGTELPVDIAQEGHLDMVLSPGGALATLVYHYAPAGGGWLFVTTSDGRSVDAPAMNLRSAPLWLPGDHGLVALGNRGVVHYSVAHGGLVTDSLPGVPAGSAMQLWLIPHELPGSEDSRG